MATTGHLSNAEIADALKRARELANANSNDSVKRPLSGDTESYNGNPPKRLNNHEDMSAGGNPITSLGSNFTPTGGMEGILIEQFQVPDSCVGLIIGRGGENITSMQNETGCKIQMSHNSNGKQMRGCTLTGTKMAIEKAKRCLEGIIEKAGGTMPPMKNGTSNSTSMVNSPSAMVQSANIGGMMPQFPGGGGGSGKMVTVEMQIPGTKCGLIIGKGGETIKQLQERAQVKMVMIQENNQVTSGYKPLRIIGEPEKIEHAKRLVEEVMCSKDDKPPMFMNDYGSSMGSNAKPGSSMGEVIVPRTAVGVIIGKNGETIRRLTLESGAKIQFKPEDTSAPERTAYIVGSPDQIQRATAMITDLVNRAISQDQNGMRGMGGMGNEAADVFYMHVPANKTGLVIGKGGETIKQISSESGARVELSRDPAPSDSEKVFVVRGTPYQIHHAQHLIRIKVGDIQPGTPIPPFNSSIPGVVNEPQFSYPGFNQPTQPASADQSAAWAAYYNSAASQYFPNPANPYGAGFPTSAASVAAPAAAAPQQATSAASTGPAINPQTGQPDYSAQWAEYYRSLGMHDQAAVIEQQARANQAAAAAAVGQSAQTGAPNQQFGAYGQQQQAATPYSYGQPAAANAYQYAAPQY